jgi:alkaline phosphatase D
MTKKREQSPVLTEAQADRRSFLKTGAAAAGAALAGGVFNSFAGQSQPNNTLIHPGTKFRYPFTLGVASGDPLSDAVVIWTRLAPSPLDPDGGMPSRSVQVYWEVARDDKFRRVDRRGLAWAHPESAHSIHVDVQDLKPGREYFYRFFAGKDWSPAGRTRTAPDRRDKHRKLRISFTSCQDFEDGYYDAYQHLIEEDSDINFFLGDYVYEGAPNPTKPRLHVGDSEMDVYSEYLTRYSQYRLDPNLQNAHGAMAWAVTFDDHEVDNDWSGDFAERPDLQPPDLFRARRAQAFKAFWEMMPLRKEARPSGPDMRVYRSLTFGDLAKFYVLDTRQFRSKSEPCGFGTGPVEGACRDIVFDPERTALGDAQERWLFDRLRRSETRWNVLAQQIPIAKLDVGEAAGPPEFKLDKWDAYPVARQRLLDLLRDAEPRNPVVITGDLHDNWVAVLKENFDDPDSKSLGTEFMGTSISSDGDGSEFTEEGELVLGNGRNPHVLFHNFRRGYVVCDITRKEWTTKLRVMPFVESPGATVLTRATWVVEDGDPVPTQTQGLPVFEDPFA